MRHVLTFFHGQKLALLLTIFCHPLITIFLIKSVEFDCASIAVSARMEIGLQLAAG
jgi:hypothetical protein